MRVKKKKIVRDYEEKMSYDDKVSTKVSGQSYDFWLVFWLVLGLEYWLVFWLVLGLVGLTLASSMESPWARWIRHALQDVRRIRHGPPDDDGAHPRRRAAIAVADVLVAPRIAIPVVLFLAVIVVVVVVVVEVDGVGDDGRGRSDVGVDPTTMRRRLQEAAGIFKIPFEPS